MRLRLVSVAIACAISSCAKDDRSQVSELVSQLQHAREWQYDATAQRGHADWLGANIAWDIVGSQTMLSVIPELAADTEPTDDVDASLKSGVAELAAGATPRDMIAQLQSWRHELGNGACAVGEPASDDADWVKSQFSVAVPSAVGAPTRAAIEAYAKRAAGIHGPLRITCGGTAALIVGKLEGKLVPLLRR